MRLVTYDIECTAYNWLVVFKDKKSGKYTCVWDDADLLRECINDDSIYVGFNSKYYDQYMIKGMVAGFEHKELKALNDYIIEGNQGWMYPGLKDIYFRFNNVDIRDDTQQGLSLKAIEGHLGLDIRESTVSFDIDRPLTADEKKEMEFYCKHDVDATEHLIDVRADYLKNKINLGKLAGLDEVRALQMTNAKLTAAMLKAKMKEHSDERGYVYPENLKKEFIQPEVFDYFNRMYDKSLSDDEVYKNKLEIALGECSITIGYGGIHGAIANYIWRES